MATNLTTVNVTQDGVYTLPVSYSEIMLLSSIDKTEQLIVQRTSIASIMSPLTLDSEEYVSFGRIPAAWITFDDTNRTITAINIPANSIATRTDGSTVAIPALVANEPLQIQRRTMYAEPYVEWVTGSRITADQLNANTEQLLGLIQEMRGQVDYLLSRDSVVMTNPATASLNMNGWQIYGLPGFYEPSSTVTSQDLTDYVLSLYGAVDGLAMLDSSGQIPQNQIPGTRGALPGSFFSSDNKPIRSSANQSPGLFKWGSLWYNTVNGRLYIYIPDDNFGTNNENFNGEVGYWVDISTNI
jgi:hypothetical protein